MILKNVTYLNENMAFETKNIAIVDGAIHFFEEGVDAEIELDCSDYFVLPGLINSHFHSYSPLTKGLMKETTIEEWSNDSKQGAIQKLFFDYIDHHVSAEDFMYVAQKSYIDMVKNGVTFVSDSDPHTPRLLAKAVKQLGIRAMIDTYDEIDEYDGQSDETILFGTHLLEEEDFTEEALLKLQQIKKKYDCTMMTHCLENEWRYNIVSSKFEKSSIDLYNELQLLDKQTVLFHGVYMSEKDIEIVAKHNATIVHCPLSNLDSGAGVANVQYMLEKEVNVALGTDYIHTNMWDLMRLTYYLLKTTSPVQKYAAEDIVKMATLNGAKAYGLHKSIGQIKEGYKADLIFIKKTNDIKPLINNNDFSNYLHNILFYSKQDAIQHVMVDGKWIMKDREILTVNESEIEQKYNEVVDGFLQYCSTQN